MEISPLHNEYRLQGTVNFLALGTANAVLRIYDGDAPAFGGTPAGNLLVEITLVEPVGTIAGGVLTLTPTDEAIVLVTGAATWARILNGDGAIGMDGVTVSDLAGSGQIKLPSTTLYAGGYTRLASGVMG